MSECILTHMVVAQRTLSNAEDRRESILRAAQSVFAVKGIHGTPTIEVARAAGISQAYLFRLYPTKEELAVALVKRCNQRIHATFADAVAQARAEQADVLLTMGMAYASLLQDRELLLLQLHAHAASASVPAIRDAMRDGFRELVEFTQRESGAEPLEIRRFFAHGMLMNVMAALGVAELADAPWAALLTGADLAEGC
ncbi:MAG: TetR family transcriptional regulator [Solirubrobacteraceae bacterium]